MAYIDIHTRVFVPEGGRKVTEKLVISLAKVAQTAVQARADKAFGQVVKVSSGYEYAYVLIAKRITTRVLRGANSAASYIRQVS